MPMEVVQHNTRFGGGLTLLKVVVVDKKIGRDDENVWEVERAERKWSQSERVAKLRRAQKNL